VSETKKTNTGFTAAEKAAMREPAVRFTAKQTPEESTKAQFEGMAGLRSRIQVWPTAAPAFVGSASLSSLPEQCRGVGSYSM